MTCRLFIDEVGNGDLRGAADDDNIRYLSLTAVLTTIDLHERAIAPAMSALKQDVFGETGIILHRREIVRREGCFAVLKDEPKADSFNHGLLALIRSSPYLTITITVTIDKRQHLETYPVWQYDPYHYCLCCLVERYVLWLQRHDLRGDVAIEPRFAQADKKVKASFQRICNQGTDNISAKAVQQRLLSHDIKFIGKKRNIAAMQLVDLLAHPSYRSMKFERNGIPDPPDFGTEIVGILKENRYARHPKTLVINGWGRKWLP